MAWMNTDILLGLVGLAFSFASFAMKRMVPLRVLALIGNVLLIVSDLIGGGITPSLVLNLALLPVNIRRLWEIKKMAKDIEQTTPDAAVSQWLLPNMKYRKFRQGDVLFRKGDSADRLIYIANGELRALESGSLIAAGELVGEIGLFSPQNQRTQTLTAVTDGHVFELAGEELFQLCYEQPKLGFMLMRLITGRLLLDITRFEAAGGGPGASLRTTASE